jgi:hypothetical protein
MELSIFIFRVKEEEWTLKMELTSSIESIGTYLPIYMESQPRRLGYPSAPLTEPQF